MGCQKPKKEGTCDNRYNQQDVCPLGLSKIDSQGKISLSENDSCKLYRAVGWKAKGFFVGEVDQRGDVNVIG